MIQNDDDDTGAPGAGEHGRTSGEGERTSFSSPRPKLEVPTSSDHGEAVSKKGFSEQAQPAIAPLVADPEAAWKRTKAKLKMLLGDDVYSSWFGSTEFESFDGKNVAVSTPTKFLKNWLQGHYSDQLLECCRPEFPGVEKVSVMLRTPGGIISRSSSAGARPAVTDANPGQRPEARRNGGPARISAAGVIGTAASSGDVFEGSPLDPRYTFESFVVGSANRLAHAAARQVAENSSARRTPHEQPLSQPLIVHRHKGRRNDGAKRRRSTDRPITRT